MAPHRRGPLAVDRHVRRHEVLTVGVANVNHEQSPARAGLGLALRRARALDLLNAAQGRRRPAGSGRGGRPVGAGWAGWAGRAGWARRAGWAGRAGWARRAADVIAVVVVAGAVAVVLRGVDASVVGVVVVAVATAVATAVTVGAV